MTHDIKINPNEYWPIIVVLGAFLISLVATTAAGMSNRATNKTLYNSIVGKSPYEPPGWVFGVVWFIIFVGYTVIWILANKRITDETMKNKINWLLGIGILINVTWSFLIIFGAIGSIPVQVAHYLSISVLFVLGAYNIFLIYHVNKAFEFYSDMSETLRNILNVVLVIYIIWPFIACFLSVTSPVN